MKAGISNIWLLGMIATFIFLFSCYVIISVNYTKSFKMKNEILTIIEKSKGMTGLGTTSAGQTCHSKFGFGDVTCKVPAFQTINIYLRGNAYTAMGYCPKDSDDELYDDRWYGVLSLDDNTYERAVEGTKYYYCFAKYQYRLAGDPNAPLSNTLSSTYYKVRLFYKMELPVLSEWLSIRVDGETGEIVDDQVTNMEIGQKA